MIALINICLHPSCIIPSVKISYWHTFAQKPLLDPPYMLMKWKILYLALKGSQNWSCYLWWFHCSFPLSLTQGIKHLHSTPHSHPRFDLSLEPGSSQKMKPKPVVDSTDLRLNQTQAIFCPDLVLPLKGLNVAQQQFQIHLKFSNFPSS